MATKRTKELQAMDQSALENELHELTEELSKMKFDHAVNGIRNPLLLRTTRRERARIATEIRRREIAEMSDEQLAKRSKIRERRR